VAAALWERGIEPVVTFHHFTTPTWLADRGGWESPDTAERYADYCQFAAGALRDELGRACTLNEPNVVATMGWVMGMFPPGKTDPALAEAATTNLAAAHRKGVEAIRAAAPGVPVGLTLSMTDYQPVGRNGASASASDSASDGHGDSEPDPAAVRRVDKIRATHEDVFLHATAGDDFLGVQTYSRMRIDAEGWAGPQPGVPTLPMGYEYWPQALEACLRRAWAVTGGRIPLWVTENGIGTDDDEQRQRFIGEALEGVLRAMADGIDVLGYTYWSLMDNFEWTFGYGPKFGLIAVDRSSFTRSPKPSAAWFASVAKAGYLP
jgi:beta-glucosidase